LSKKASSSKNDRIQFDKINAYIQALKVYGTRIGNPVVKHIDGDLWELRPLNNRIFSFICVATPFYKENSKTPIKEIEKARNNLKDFMERIDDNEHKNRK
jgi:phage-related protein